MNGKDSIRLRPHHGLCIQHYVGRGYDERFTENMNQVTKHLRDNPKQEVVLCADTDILCGFCPHMQGGVCESSEKVAGYDARCLALCGLHDGQRLSWGEFKQLVIERIIMEKKLCDVCAECCWLSLCESVLH